AVGEISIDEPTRTLTAPVASGHKALTDVLRGLDAQEIAILDIGLRRPTLDDVFLTLTGQATDEIDEPEYKEALR
ncbi:MAG TPA: daunorubicin/doxorubicin resistance ABC transporter ATP-binding protein DrrA, partial [Acidimicrobiia bacterium]